MPAADRQALEATLQAVAGPGGVVHLIDDGAIGRYRLAGARPSPEIIATLTGWCAAHSQRIVELRTDGATLEERYLELTAGPAETGR